jgi:deoxyribose-phosphate aldolase
VPDKHPIIDEKRRIAALIDHTLLKPEATRQQVDRLCKEAREYGFASACVNPYWVPVAGRALEGSRVKVCTVIGFPLGANLASVKAFETRKALEQGATELDMVQNIGALESGDDHVVEDEIAELGNLAHANGAILKVILETCLLTEEARERACRLAVHAGADFVKTSTGFSTGGATVEDIRLMRRIVGPKVGVKASGGIRTLEAVRAMLAAGATRIGASAGVSIVQELDKSEPARAPVSSGY